MELGVDLARNALLSAIAGAWIVSIAWVIADARSRLPKARTVRLAVALVGCLPLFGLFVWLLVRPAETLTERWAAELRRLLFAQVAESHRCPVCRTVLEAEYRCCPGCGLELQRPCEGCGASVHATSETCVRCGTGSVAEPPAALRSAAG